MAQRLFLITVFLLLVADQGVAQQPAPPPPAPGITLPKIPDPPPPPKALTAEELDVLTEKAFGKDCAELKRPIRVWIPDVGMMIAAQTATVARDGFSVRFASASAGLTSESQVFRGEEIVVNVHQAVKVPGDLRLAHVLTVEVHAKNAIVTLTPGPGPMPAFTANSPSNVQVTPTPFSAPPIQAATREINTPRLVTARFKFNIDPKAPLVEMLPTPVKTSAKLPRWTNEDLTKVPELHFGEQVPRSMPKHQATEATAHTIAKINHLNGKKTDGFLLAMLEQRTDLRGLPFLMGDDCRTREEQARDLGTIAGTLRILTSEAGRKEVLTQMEVADALAVMLTPQRFGGNQPQPRIGGSRESYQRATVAALTQILMPESEPMRVGMAKHLATIPNLEATKALARLILFSPEESVRNAAIEGLKLRREKDYTDVLMQGFRYPLPAVSKRAAEALVKLERKDLLANLIDVLETPDPRLPVTEKRDGKDVTFVREVVKVNHHSNCLLCHAPGNTDNTPETILKVAVPLPGEALPRPAETQYYSTPPSTPDIVVRLDMTYLRQDFSVMMPVSDARPWPEMQRFDFLVRTRVLTSAEAQAYEPEQEEAGRVSAYHRAALFALRELTGRDTEPTAVAWRKLLKL